MREFNNKLKVFISSKTGNTLADEKYVLARVAAKETLESTGLFKVYSFESEGPSVNSALEHYTEGLKDSDVCIFLIDNKDGVPQGVQIEIDTVNKYQIPSLYYFCQGDEKEKTQAQIDLLKPTKSKHTKKINTSTTNLPSNKPNSLDSSQTIPGMKTIATALNASRTQTKTESTSLANALAFSSPPSPWSALLYIGTKATLKAPSANRRRKVLGKVKAS